MAIFRFSSNNTIYISRYLAFLQDLLTATFRRERFEFDHLLAKISIEDNLKSDGIPSPDSKIGEIQPISPLDSVQLSILNM